MRPLKSRGFPVFQVSFNHLREYKLVTPNPFNDKFWKIFNSLAINSRITSKMSIKYYKIIERVGECKTIKSTTTILCSKNYYNTFKRNNDER